MVLMIMIVIMIMIVLDMICTVAVRGRRGLGMLVQAMIARTGMTQSSVHDLGARQAQRAEKRGGDLRDTSMWHDRMRAKKARGADDEQHDRSNPMVMMAVGRNDGPGTQRNGQPDQCPFHPRIEQRAQPHHRQEGDQEWCERAVYRAHARGHEAQAFGSVHVCL